MFKWRFSKRACKKKILLADDEINIVRTVVDRLEMSGYEVVTACDGEETIAKAVHEKPDLILLDIVMPKMDGHNVLRTLRQAEATRHVPVFMFTAQSQAEDVYRANEAGAKKYFVKPFDLVELLNSIEAALAAGVAG